jgi:tetratricopeptide (TPR) repeat protein
MADDDIKALEAEIKALKDKIDKQGTAFLQGQINSLKTGLALRSESTKESFNSKNESTNQRITTHRNCLYLILILFPIIGFFVGKDFIKKTVSTSVEKSVEKKTQPIIDKYKKDLDVRITTMGNRIEFNYWYKVGEKEFEYGDYASAVKSFTKALEKNPNHVYAVGVRGIAYTRLGMMKEAIVDLDKAIDIKEDYAIAYGYKGLAHFGLREYVATFNAFHKGIDLFMKRGDYENASLEISVMSSYYDEAKVDEKFDEGMRKSVEDVIVQLKKQLEETKKKSKEVTK